MTTRDAKLLGQRSLAQLVLSPIAQQGRRKLPSRSEPLPLGSEVVTIVGAAVLVPGLVAAIFGANVGFHGRESSGAFWAMLLLMAGSGTISYALIRSFETAFWEKVRGHRSVNWFFDLPAGTQLGACAVFGLVVLVVGMALLIAS